MALDPGRWRQTDQAILGGAAVVFVAGFLPWLGYTGPLSFDRSGWSSGVSAWAGILLLALAGCLLALHLAGAGLPELPVAPGTAVAALAAAGLALLLVRGLTFPALPGLARSPRYGYWIALGAGIVESAAAGWRLRASRPPHE